MQRYSRYGDWTNKKARHFLKKDVCLEGCRQCFYCQFRAMVDEIQNLGSSRSVGVGANLLGVSPGFELLRSAREADPKWHILNEVKETFIIITEFWVIGYVLKKMKRIGIIVTNFVSDPIKLQGSAILEGLSQELSNLIAKKFETHKKYKKMKESVLLKTLYEKEFKDLFSHQHRRAGNKLINDSLYKFLGNIHVQKNFQKQIRDLDTTNT